MLLFDWAMPNLRKKGTNDARNDIRYKRIFGARRSRCQNHGFLKRMPFEMQVVPQPRGTKQAPTDNGKGKSVYALRKML